jgi:hypothetical protein
MFLNAYAQLVVCESFVSLGCLGGSLVPVLLVPCSVNEENIETMKQRWLDQGKPKYPDWAKLMEGMVE